MAHQDGFSGYHPLVNFAYFACVLLFTMFLRHPLTLLLSFLGAFCYLAELQGLRAAARSLAALTPVVLLSAVLNPAFNHAGATILTYLPTGNPLTLESILYGLVAAVMLAAAILWFLCYTAVMTSDKFIYLFGRVIPVLSLLLSMTLRFVPRFRAQLHTVREAQRCMGRDVSSGNGITRVKNAVAILSILVTWALENAVETADSMQSRGYGLPGRTAFSIYRFTHRDDLALGWIFSCAVYLVYGWFSGALRWQFYPLFSGKAALGYQFVYLALCLTPIILNRGEEWLWKRSRSEI